MSYRIKTVAERTGIPKNTLIAWERRYGVVVPARTDSGYRAYSDHDVAVLSRLKDLVDAGYRISEAIALVQRNGLRDAQDSDVADTDTALEGARDRILSHLIDMSRARAETEALRLVTVSYARLVQEVYLPMMQEVGDRWERGEVTVAQEHFVTAYCREQILAMMRSLAHDDPMAPEAVCATPSGERHEIGLLGVALHLVLRGYRLTYLGADVPLEELIAVIEARKPILVGLSWVNQADGATIQSWVESIEAAMPDDALLLIGGRGTLHLRAQSTARAWLGSTLADLDRLPRLRR
jgi:DNA-binding transcriptional MerR regulator